MILSGALDLLLPRRCLGCGRMGAYFCTDCLPKLQRIGHACPLCARPLDERHAALCEGILPPGLDGLASAFVFEGIIREAVHQFKYNNLKDIAPALSRFMFEQMLAAGIVADMIVPVPLHASRLKERGYNQTELLSRHLSHLSGLPAESRLLVRVKPGAPQAKSARVEERRANVGGAFICYNKFQGGTVLLLDDVATSCSTLSATAMALKAAGVKRVLGLTIAREI